MEAVNARVNRDDWAGSLPISGGHARMTREIVSVWRALAGARTDIYRTLLRRWYYHCATPQHVIYYKREPAHGIKDDLRLLVVMGRALIPDAEFRRRTLPVLLLPAPLVRRSPRLRARLGAWDGSPVCRFTDCTSGGAVAKRPSYRPRRRRTASSVCRGRRSSNGRSESRTAR